MYIIFLLLLTSLGCQLSVIESPDKDGDTSITAPSTEPSARNDLNRRANVTLLIHAPGMGIAQTSPHTSEGNRPRTGQYPLQCDGTFPVNGADARFTKFWLWLDNASYQPSGPLPQGTQAPSFGHLSRRLEDAGYNIKISFDKNMLKKMLDDEPLVVITASKGIAEVIEGVNDKNYSGSLLLINGATMPGAPITSNIKAAVLTHGLKDTHGSRATGAKIKSMLGNKAGYFIYENIHDGHNPRSLVFPSDAAMKTDKWPSNCFSPSPSWLSNNSPGGNHRVAKTDSYLVDLVDALAIDDANWQKNLIPLLSLDANVSKSWEGQDGIRSKP